MPPATAPAITSPTFDAVQMALELLLDAQRPLIIAGGGILRSGATKDLVAFAELAGIPVMGAFRRLDVFPGDHPLSLGWLSFGTPAAMVERARNADVVMAIGTRLAELTTLGYTVPNQDAALIHIDVSPEEIGRSFPARVAIACRRPAGAHDASY